MTDSLSLPSAERIAEALKSSGKGPLKAKELAQLLKVPTALYRDFRGRLREMEARGELYRNRAQRYAMPSEIHLVVGRLQVIRSGDGFLRPEEVGARDIYISQRHFDSAMDGDRVVARVEAGIQGPDRGPVGRVVKILERGRPTVVGTFQANRRFGFVTPLDRRIGRDILIPEGHAAEAKSGDVVVVRIQQYADSKRNALGEVEKVLGGMQEPGVDVLAILHGYGLPATFPEEVEAAAAEAGKRFFEPGEREDLRELMVFTIDPVDARDHDDALSLRPLGDGWYEVGIHIADVAHFVEEGRALDLEALQRGTSVYLVDQVIPMLPHALSSGLCSLTQGEDRLAVSVLVELDTQGTIRSHRFSETLIQCRLGLHYEQVHGVLARGESLSPEVDETLRTLDSLASALRRRRKARGSLDFDLPEARVVLDADGAPVDIQKVVQLDSHRLIEDFMLLANEIVAEALLAREIPTPFRIHEPPAADRIEELRGFLDSVGHGLGGGKVSPKRLQAILDAVRGRPEETLVSTVVLRSMSRARYAPENMGHFGLASEAYLHFTSPIRRYPDLVTHRAVKEVLIRGGRIPERWTAALADVCDQASDRERVAQQAERDSIEMKKIEFMRRHLGDEFEGTIAGVTAFGFFVLLDRVFVEGLVHVSTLGDDYYTFVQEAYALVGERNYRRFRLGDRVRVQVVRADKEERKIDFLLLEGGSDGTAADLRKKKPSGPSRGGRKGKGGRPPRRGSR
jgi:ribonuclease R